MCLYESLSCKASLSARTKIVLAYNTKGRHMTIPEQEGTSAKSDLRFPSLTNALKSDLRFPSLTNALKSDLRFSSLTNALGKGIRSESRLFEGIKGRCKFQNIEGIDDDEIVEQAHRELTAREKTQTILDSCYNTSPIKLILERLETMQNSKSSVVVNGDLNVHDSLVNIGQGNKNEFNISSGTTASIAEQLEQFRNQLNTLEQLNEDQKDLLSEAIGDLIDHLEEPKEKQVEWKKRLSRVVKSLEKCGMAALEALAISMGTGFGNYWVNLIVG